MTPALTHEIPDGESASRAAWAGRRDGDAISRPADRRAASLSRLWERPGRLFSHAVKLMLGYWLRRSLRTLSDQQLRDAGIDPAAAGRGRAADVTVDPNIGSGY